MIKLRRFISWRATGRKRERRDKTAQAVLDNIADVGPKSRGPQARVNYMEVRERPGEMERELRYLVAAEGSFESR